jgi:engulfment/cell motility protein 1
MTEALSVVDSLRAASQLPILTNESSLTLNTTLTSTTDRKVLPLKMALFNLQKYIKEGDFAVELMLKGGLRLLIALVERVSGGLSGNSLAVSPQTWGSLMSVRTTRYPWSS